jgi:biopolymer transport protein ExbB
MDIFDAIIKFFQEGGTFMYPVLFAFAIGGAIALERYIKLTYVRHVNRRVWNKVQPMLASGGFEEARDMINDDSTEISSVLRIGLENQGMHRRREDIELAMEDNLRDIVPHLEKRTPYVALFSNISTLLGLLGTIMGLIEAFTAVANANPSEKADLLSASISVAMNTTAFGLMSGITLLIMHTILTSKTAEIIDSLERVSVKTLKIITDFAHQNIADSNV